MDRLPTASVLACDECDLLHTGVLLPRGTSAHCRRCGARLARNSGASLDRPLALALAAVVMFVVANANDILQLQVSGQITSSTLAGAVARLWDQGMWIIALIVALTAMVFPFLQLASMCYLLAPLRNGSIPPGFAVILRMIQALQPWGMLEVFVLGSLVALAKLAKIATVAPGAGLWAFGALILLAAGAAMSFDSEDLWRRMEELFDSPEAGAGESQPTTT